MFYNKSKHVKKEEQEKETDMNGIMIVLTLLSGVALFLYGMSLMGDGLKRVAGNQLELVLYKLTNTPIKVYFLER